MLHYAHACVRGGGLGVEGSSPMTPRGEAPKNPAGTNALGPVGIGPKAPLPAQQSPAAAGLLFLKKIFIFSAMSATLCEEGPSPREAKTMLLNTHDKRMHWQCGP